MQGIHLQPLTISKSDSHRPVISQITIQSLPFLPYTVTVPLSLTHMRVTPTGLYWSDLFSGEIFRSQLDGGMAQLVLQKVALLLLLLLFLHLTLRLSPSLCQVDRVYGLGVIEDESTAQHHIFFTDASKGTFGRVTIPSQGPSSSPHSHSLSHSLSDTSISVRGPHLSHFLFVFSPPHGS
jgi:hypothetical protein